MFLLDCLCFYCWIFESSLDILDMSPFSDKQIVSSFSQLAACVFILFIESLAKVRVLHLNEVQFINFFLLWTVFYVLLSCLRTLLQALVSEDFLLGFIIVLCLMFKSMIYFDLILYVVSDLDWASFILPIDIHLLWPIYWRHYSSSIVLLLHLCQKSVGLALWVCFWALYIFLLLCLGVL